MRDSLGSSGAATATGIGKLGRALLALLTLGLIGAAPAPQPAAAAPKPAAEPTPAPAQAATPAPAPAASAAPAAQSRGGFFGWLKRLFGG